MENSMQVLKKLKMKNYHMIQQPYFWAYIQRKLVSQRAICPPVFMSALFTISQDTETT